MLVIGGGSQEEAARLARMLKLSVPVLADADRGVYQRYGLDKVLFVIQRSATVLVDKQGIVRYIQRATNPNASLDMAELLREVEKLQER